MIKPRRILNILSKEHIQKLPFIVFAMLIGAGFEVVGLSLIIPLLDVITNASQSKFVGFLSSSYPTLSNDQVIILMIALFALIYVIKGLYLALLASMISNFVFGVKVSINKRLMQYYINVPYEFHLKNNSSSLIRNITIEARTLVFHTLIPLLVIATESLVIIAFMIFLVWLEPLGTVIVVSLLLLSGLLFQGLIKNFMEEIGTTRLNADGLIVQKAQEAIGGIKDIKVLLKEDAFMEHFSKYNLLSSEADAQHYTWSQFPRMYLETIGVVTLSVLLLFLTINSANSAQVIPTFGLFALAAFRLLPSANRIMISFGNLRYSSSVIGNIEQQLNDAKLLRIHTTNEYEISNSLSFVKSIDIQNISHSYDSETISLHNISISIKKGESIGIIGKSGAGKSTLVDVILGLLAPTSGAIAVDGNSIYENLIGWQQIVGYVQQDVFLLDDSILKNIAFGIHEENIDYERLYQVVNETQLDDFVYALSEGLNTQLGERGIRLSGGQKQRIGIARALYHKSSVLVFDEATSALDTETETEIMSEISNLKGDQTIIVIAHRLSTLKHCDRILELSKGSIVNTYQGIEMEKLVK
ncbi:ABC transporter ATP-binding protein/permease [Gammaproteobacteria bacterium]|nr:ABC transporter ATP-binding protein/permease [Gammaproteobacteria bacterium]